MKKLLLAAVLIIGSVSYAFVERGAAAQTTAPLATVASDTSSVATANEPATSAPATQAPAPAASPAPVATPAPKPASNGMYKNGTYTGSVADAYYGNIQVEAVISGGRLSNVKILQYPNDRGTSIEINRQALPYLVSEAIAAQSANVDGISGASDTSAAFVESLRSALAKAKA